MNQFFPLVLIAFSLAGQAFGQCPSIYRRSQWGARPPNGFTNMSMPVRNVLVHHTEGRECLSLPECISEMQAIQNLHMDSNGWADIGYSFLIGGDGSVYEGRGWNRVGAHSPGCNDKSIGISLMGSFMNKLPPQVQMDAAKAMIACAVQSNYVVSTYRLYGHRDTRATDCPGDAFYADLSGWPNKQGINMECAN